MNNEADFLQTSLFGLNQGTMFSTIDRNRDTGNFFTLGTQSNLRRQPTQNYSGITYGVSGNFSQNRYTDLGTFSYGLGASYRGYQYQGIPDITDEELFPTPDGTESYTAQVNIIKGSGFFSIEFPSGTTIRLEGNVGMESTMAQLFEQGEENLEERVNKDELSWGATAKISMLSGNLLLDFSLRNAPSGRETSGGIVLDLGILSDKIISGRHKFFITGSLYQHLPTNSLLQGPFQTTNVQVGYTFNPFQSKK